MDVPSGTPRPDSFTQSCRDLIRTFTHEDISACTIYAAPMLFMIGPASIVGHEPFLAVVVQSLVGFSLSRTIHRMGHRLLSALPKKPCNLYVSPSWCLPVKLTVTQFLWAMELVIGAAVFAAVVGKRFLHTSEMDGWLIGLSFLVVASVLYFAPVYLGRLWIRRYYPAMTLVGPTDEIIKTTLPGIRSLFTFSRSPDT